MFGSREENSSGCSITKRASAYRVTTNMLWKRDSITGQPLARASASRSYGRPTFGSELIRLTSSRRQLC
jgi:hypothetical protein